MHGTTLHVHDPRAQTFARLLFVCGGVISAVMLVGLGLVLSRRIRPAVPYADVALVLVAGLSVAAYAMFTYRVATFSALKGSYLSPGVPAFAVLAGLGFDWAAHRLQWFRTLRAVFLGFFVLTSTAISWSGGLAPMRANPADFYIRVYSDEPSRRVYEYFVVGRER